MQWLTRFVGFMTSYFLSDDRFCLKKKIMSEQVFHTKIIFPGPLISMHLWFQMMSPSDLVTGGAFHTNLLAPFDHLSTLLIPDLRERKRHKEHTGTLKAQKASFDGLPVSLEYLLFAWIHRRSNFNYALRFVIFIRCSEKWVKCLSESCWGATVSRRRTPKAHHRPECKPWELLYNGSSPKEFITTVRFLFASVLCNIYPMNNFFARKFTTIACVQEQASLYRIKIQ